MSRAFSSGSILFALLLKISAGGRDDEKMFLTSLDIKGHLLRFGLDPQKTIPTGGLTGCLEFGIPLSSPRCAECMDYFPT